MREGIRFLLGHEERTLDTVDGLLAETGKALGPPWQKDHRVAMCAAIAATRA